MNSKFKHIDKSFRRLIGDTYSTIINERETDNDPVVITALRETVDNIIESYIKFLRKTAFNIDDTPLSIYRITTTIYDKAGNAEVLHVAIRAGIDEAFNNFEDEKYSVFYYICSKKLLKCYNAKSYTVTMENIDTCEKKEWERVINDN